MEETAWGVKKVNSPCSVFQPFFPVLSNNSYVNASRTRIKRYSNISSLYPFSENQYQPHEQYKKPTNEIISVSYNTSTIYINK